MTLTLAPWGTGGEPRGTAAVTGSRSCRRGRVAPCVAALGSEAPVWVEQEGGGMTCLAASPVACGAPCPCHE